MLQIGYFSTAAVPQSAAAVHEVLTTARQNNGRDEITGLLVAGANRYLEVIEAGPRVRALYAKIVADARHTAVTRFSHRHIRERSFGSWAMAFRRPDVHDDHNVFQAWLRIYES